VKRLTILLDDGSEKGFGLTTGHAALFTPYDIIALAPTTAATFSLACLTHTQPSPLTSHIISLPLTLPRLPFNLKHTLVRSALKNGAVFEITYNGALGGECDLTTANALGGEGGAGAKRNWWAAAREVVRVTKGKGIIVSSGSLNQADLRAPRDIANLITVLGLPQNVAHEASTKIPQSLLLRAQTRRTYRAILSEPKIVIPESWTASQIKNSAPTAETTVEAANGAGVPPSRAAEEKVTPIVASAQPNPPASATSAPARTNGQKRPREDEVVQGPSQQLSGERDGPARKKKKRKNKEAKDS